MLLSVTTEDARACESREQKAEQPSSMKIISSVGVDPQITPLEAQGNQHVLDGAALYLSKIPLASSTSYGERSCYEDSSINPGHHAALHEVDSRAQEKSHVTDLSEPEQWTLNRTLESIADHPGRAAVSSS